MSDRTTYPLQNADNIDTDPFKARTVTFYKSLFPVTVRAWNLLDPKMRSTLSSDEFKTFYCQKDPKPNQFNYLGLRRLNIIHARLRMNCRLLGAHLYSWGIITSPICLCGHPIEDSLHYFLVCPNYITQRAVLHGKIIIHTPFTLYTILHGTESVHTNNIIICAVHEFIELYFFLSFCFVNILICHPS